MPYRYNAISKFSKKEIDALFKQAHRVVNHPFLYILRGNKGEKPGRMLVMVSKKVGSAPNRNLFRRRAKSIFYTDKLYQHMTDIIVITRPGAIDIPFTELQQLLHKAFV